MIELLATTTADGWTVKGPVFRAENPVGTVLALHAMMVDGRSLHRDGKPGLATTLVSEGWNVWAPDFRGHRHSARGTGDLWTYDDLVRFDIPAMVQRARGLGGPLLGLGHSLGGHTMAAAVTEGVKLDGLVGLGANVWMPSLEPSMRQRAKKAVAMRAMRGLAEGVGRFPSRLVRVGPCDEALPYVRDLTRFWFRDRWASRDGRDWLEGKVNCPVLAVAGSADSLLCQVDAMRQYWDCLAPADVWLAGSGSFGLSEEITHMGLGTNPACEGMWRSIAGWGRQTLVG